MTSEAGSFSENEDDTSDETPTEEGGVIVDDAHVNMRLGQRQRNVGRMERGPRSISAILDPRLYEDIPDLNATPPPDPTLFPELTRAVQEEMRNLEREHQEKRLRQQEALALAMAAAANGDTVEGGDNGADVESLEDEEDDEEGEEAEDELLPMTRARVQSMTQAAHLGILRAKSEATSIIKTSPARLMVIYNPVSGSGQGERVAKECLVPILRLARVAYTIHATQYASHATEMVKAADIAKISGVVVCGGDGMVSEILTGLLTHGAETVARVRVGIIPTGTANAIANVLDGGVSKRPSDLIHRAALAVAAGHSRELDVLEIVQKPLDVSPLAKGVATSGSTLLKPVTEERTQYGMVRLGCEGEVKGESEFAKSGVNYDGSARLLKCAFPLPIWQSCVAWGLAGACTARAERLRWVPGQKKLRYDLAGFLTLCGVSEKHYSRAPLLHELSSDLKL